MVHRTSRRRSARDTVRDTSFTAVFAYDAIRVFDEDAIICDGEQRARDLCTSVGKRLLAMHRLFAYVPLRITL